MIRVAQLTSAHPRYDTRIFIKVSSSLAKHNYDVSLIVADGKGDETKNGVKIFDVGAKSGGRISRMTKTVGKVFEKAKTLDADIYHLHDPELTPVGLKLKKIGKIVIFDAHEDLPKQILGKAYLNQPAKIFLSAALAAYERFSCKKLDAIITATPFIRDKFLTINPNTIDINNFPVIGELDSATQWHEKRNEVCYVGGIDAIRGIREVVRACELLQSSARLNLAGTFSEPELESEVKTYAGWARVNQLDYQDRTGVRAVMGNSVAGLVTLHPAINYLDALPVKMFEYMAAGIPVIASYFPLWQEIVEGNDCGLCINPLDPKAIAVAIDFMINNPERARQMGENGRRAVIEKYNWGVEETKLIVFYRSLLES